MKDTSSVLISGSLAFDIIFSVSDDFRQAVKVHAGEVRSFNATYVAGHKTEYPGGTAGNIAFWLGQAGVPSTIFSAWGQDLTDRGYRGKLEQLGVQLRGFEGMFSAHAYMVSDPLHQQLIIWQPNAYEMFEQIALDEYFTTVELEDITWAIFSPGSMASSSRQIKELRAVNQRVQIILDPGQMGRFWTKEAFQEACLAANILIGNDMEFVFFREWGIPEHLIQIETRGAAGVVVREAGQEWSRPAAPVQKVVESTGAGDGFRGGLLSVLAQGGSLAEAVDCGLQTAARVVELPSGQI